jgi:molecular chaperone DnaK (HSP70)
MVEESVQHAFEDLRARQWIEAKLRAAETLAAARKGLADCAGEIESACQEQIESAMRAVEEVLAGENLASQMGDANLLKAAMAALDEASKPLAELLMDKAMDALLRKRGIIK